MGKNQFIKVHLWVILAIISSPIVYMDAVASPSSMESNGMMMPPNTHSESMEMSEMPGSSMSDSMMSDQSMPSHSMPSQNSSNDFLWTSWNE